MVEFCVACCMFMLEQWVILLSNTYENKVFAAITLCKHIQSQ